MPLDGHPGNYNLALLTNRTNCTFLDASKSIAAVDFGAIFPPNATDDENMQNNATSALIRVPLFDLATYISLNLPMQSFGIVDMFDAEKAAFEDVVDCAAENERLAVRDVVQESRFGRLATIRRCYLGSSAKDVCTRKEKLAKKAVVRKGGCENFIPIANKERGQG